MLKVEKLKNDKGVEFNTIQIGELMKVSPEMFETNDDIYNGGYKVNEVSIFFIPLLH